MTFHRFIPLLFICSVSCAQQACAAVEIFFDFTEWQNALTSVTTIGFTGFPDGTGITNQYEQEGVVFAPPPSFVLNGFDTFPNDGAGLHGSSFSDQIVANFLEPQYGIAFHFPGTLQIQLSFQNQFVFLSDELGGAGIGHFVGFVLDTPFDGAVVTDPLSVVVIDDLHFGVPAPGVLPLLALAEVMGKRRSRETSS